MLASLAPSTPHAAAANVSRLRFTPHSCVDLRSMQQEMRVEQGMWRREVEVVAFLRWLSRKGLPKQLKEGPAPKQKGNARSTPAIDAANAPGRTGWQVAINSFWLWPGCPASSPCRTTLADELQEIQVVEIADPRRDIYASN